MRYVIPDYYQEFRCTADACEDTCCAGWQIVIDERALKKYRSVKGPFRRRMLKSVNWRQRIFRQDRERRCAFLNQNNLCDLYTVLGEKSLCRTCRLYPRHIEEFEGVREMTLSVSCPEVAKMLMEREQPVRFYTYEKVGEEEFDYFDPFLYSMLADAREAMLLIVGNRRTSLNVRVGLILGMAHDIQGRILRQEIFSAFDVIERYQKDSAREFVEGMAERRQTENGTDSGEFVVHQMFRGLYDLELLREDWDMLLMETEELLYAGGRKQYERVSAEFSQWAKEKLPNMDVKLEQLLVYFLFTYFCGAVYDGEAYAKAQMAVISTILIRELWMGRWIKNGRDLNIEEMTELVYRYSRELEHSDQNLKKMEQMRNYDVEVCMRSFST